MQDPPPFPQLTKPNFTFPEQEQLKCPRCDSTNTKFCYYNNYNLSQPRHFCKTCRRYWTKGGALRNIPVGGGTRKNNSSSKRSSSSSTSTPSPSSSDDPVANPNSSSKRLHTPPDPTQHHHTPPFMGLAPSPGSVPITTGFLDHPITQMTVDDATTTNTTGGFISMFNSPTTHQHQHPQQQQMIGNLNFLHGLNHGGGAPMVIPSARIFSTASTNTSTSTTTQNYPIPTPEFNLTGSDQSTTHNRDTNSNHPDLLQRISTNDEAGRDLSSSEGFYRSIQQLQQNGWPGGGLTINTTTSTTTTPPSSSRRPPTQ